MKQGKPEVKHEMPDEFYKLLEDLQAVDFVLVELNLYLDTHPYDQDAIAQFNDFSQRSKQLRQQVEKYYGPLTEYGFGQSYSGYPFTWSQTPWPWQL